MPFCTVENSQMLSTRDIQQNTFGRFRETEEEDLNIGLHLPILAHCMLLRKYNYIAWTDDYVAYRTSYTHDTALTLCRLEVHDKSSGLQFQVQNKTKVVKKPTSSNNIYINA